MRAAVPLKIIACRHEVPLVDTRGSGLTAYQGVFISVDRPQAHAHSVEKHGYRAEEKKDQTRSLTLPAPSRHPVKFSLSLVGRRSMGTPFKDRPK